MSKINGTTIPYGWERRIHASNNSVTYISPTGVILSSIAEVCQYLENNSTCKCGLQCPLHVPKIFNFNPDVRSINMTKNDWSLHENKTESHKKNCQHWNKLQKSFIVKKKVMSNAEVSSEPPPKLIIIRKDGQLTSLIPDNKHGTSSAPATVKKESKETRTTTKTSVAELAGSNVVSRKSSAVSPLKSPLFENAPTSARKSAETTADTSKNDFKLQWIKADDDSESGTELCFSPDSKSPTMSFPQLGSPPSTLFKQEGSRSRSLFMQNPNAASMGGMPSMQMGIEPVHRFGMSAFPGTNFVSKAESAPRYPYNQPPPRYPYMNVKTEQELQQPMSYSAPTTMSKTISTKGSVKQGISINEHHVNMGNWSQHNMMNFSTGQPRLMNMEWQRTPASGMPTAIRQKGQTMNTPTMRQTAPQQFPMGSPPACHSVSPYNHPVGTPGTNVPLSSPGSGTNPSPFNNRPNSRSSSMGTPTPSPLPHGPWQGQRIGYCSDSSRPHSRSSSINPKLDSGQSQMTQWNIRPTNPGQFHSKPQGSISSGSELSPGPISPFSPGQRFMQNPGSANPMQGIRPQGPQKQGFMQDNSMNLQKNITAQSQQHFRSNIVPDIHQQYIHQHQPGMQMDQFNARMPDFHRFGNPAAFQQQNIFRPTPPYRLNQIQFARINEPDSNRFHLGVNDQQSHRPMIRHQRPMMQQPFPHEPRWRSFNPNLHPSMQGQHQQFNIARPRQSDGMYQHRPSIKPKRQRKRRTSKVNVPKTESLPEVNPNFMSNEFPDFLQPHPDPLSVPVVAKQRVDSAIVNDTIHMGHAPESHSLSDSSSLSTDGLMPNLIMPTNLQTTPKVQSSIHMSNALKSPSISNSLISKSGLSHPPSNLPGQQFLQDEKDSGRRVMTPPLPVLSPTLLLEEATAAVEDDDDFSDFASPASAVFEFPVGTISSNSSTIMSAPPTYMASMKRRLSNEINKSSTMTLTSSVDMKVASKVNVTNEMPATKSLIGGSSHLNKTAQPCFTEPNLKTFDSHKKRLPATYPKSCSDNTRLVSSTGKVFQVPARRDQAPRRFSDDNTSDPSQTDPRKRMWSDPYPPYKPAMRRSDRKDSQTLPFSCTNFKPFTSHTQSLLSGTSQFKNTPSTASETQSHQQVKLSVSMQSVPPYQVAAKDAVNKPSHINAEPYKLPSSIKPSGNKLEFLPPKVINRSPIPTFSSSAVPRILKPPPEAPKSSKTISANQGNSLKSHSVATDVCGTSKSVKILSNLPDLSCAAIELEHSINKNTNVLATVSRLTPSYIQKENESFVVEKSTKIDLVTSTSIDISTLPATSGSDIDNSTLPYSSDKMVSPEKAEIPYSYKPRRSENQPVSLPMTCVPSSIRALYSVSIPNTNAEPQAPSLSPLHSSNNEMPYISKNTASIKESIVATHVNFSTVYGQQTTIEPESNPVSSICSQSTSSTITSTSTPVTNITSTSDSLPISTSFVNIISVSNAIKSDSSSIITSSISVQECLDMNSNLNATSPRELEEFEDDNKEMSCKVSETDVNSSTEIKSSDQTREIIEEKRCEKPDQVNKVYVSGENATLESTESDEVPDIDDVKDCVDNNTTTPDTRMDRPDIPTDSPTESTDSSTVLNVAEEQTSLCQSITIKMGNKDIEEKDITAVSDGNDDSSLHPRSPIYSTIKSAEVKEKNCEIENTNSKSPDEDERMDQDMNNSPVAETDLNVESIKSEVNTESAIEMETNCAVLEGTSKYVCSPGDQSSFAAMQEEVSVEEKEDKNEEMSNKVMTTSFTEIDTSDLKVEEDQDILCEQHQSENKASEIADTPHLFSPVVTSSSGNVCEVTTHDTNENISAQKRPENCEKLTEAEVIVVSVTDVVTNSPMPCPLSTTSQKTDLSQLPDHQSDCEGDSSTQMEAITEQGEEGNCSESEKKKPLKINQPSTSQTEKVDSVVPSISPDETITVIDKKELSPGESSEKVDETVATEKHFETKRNLIANLESLSNKELKLDSMIDLKKPLEADSDVYKNDVHFSQDLKTRSVASELYIEPVIESQSSCNTEETKLLERKITEGKYQNDSAVAHIQEISPEPPFVDTTDQEGKSLTVIKTTPSPTKVQLSPDIAKSDAVNDSSMDECNAVNDSISVAETDTVSTKSETSLTQTVVSQSVHVMQSNPAKSAMNMKSTDDVVTLSSHLPIDNKKRELKIVVSPGVIETQSSVSASTTPVTMGISPELTDTVIRQLSSYNNFLKNLLVSGVGPVNSAALAKLASSENKPDEEQMKMISALITNTMQMNMLQTNQTMILTNKSQSCSEAGTSGDTKTLNNRPSSSDVGKVVIPETNNSELESSSQNVDANQNIQEEVFTDRMSDRDEDKIPPSSSSGQSNQGSRPEKSGSFKDTVDSSSIESTAVAANIQQSMDRNDKSSISQATTSLDADSSQCEANMQKPCPSLSSVEQNLSSCSHQGLQVPIVSSSVKGEGQRSVEEEDSIVENKVDESQSKSIVQEEVSTSADVPDPAKVEQTSDHPISTVNVVVEKRRGRSRNIIPKRNLKRGATSDLSSDKAKRLASSSTPVLSNLRPIPRTTTEKPTRTVKSGDLIWGQMRGFPSWPGKIVKPSEVRGLLQRAPLSDGKVWVKWFGDHTFTQMNPADLRTMTEGLEAHHKSRKKGRTRNRKISIHLETAIQEAVDELEQQQELKQGGSKKLPTPPSSTSSCGVNPTQSLEAGGETSTSKPRRGRKRKT